MILVADSGSTKTDWALCSNTVSREKFKPDVLRIQTQGINPFHQSRDVIMGIIREELLLKCFEKFQLNRISETISEVAFYGAGCNTTTIPLMRYCLQEVFPQAVIEVAGDMLGAARALYGKSGGVACILGTGSNSCFYDGRKIVRNVPPLGYILGDEGSGAALGKLFLNGIFKGDISGRIRDKYLEQAGLTYTDVIERVYRKPLANRFLANTSKFILENIQEDDLKRLVKFNFYQFFSKNIRHYDDLGNNKISAIGSVSYYFKDFFQEIADDFGYEVVKIERSPLMGILNYQLLSF